MIRKITVGKDLERFAKDEQGNGIEAANSAEDCIVRGNDLDRYRAGIKVDCRSEKGGAGGG